MFLPISSEENEQFCLMYVYLFSLCDLGYVKLTNVPECKTWTSMESIILWH